MEYQEAHVVAGVDSDGHVYFRVKYNGETLSFSEMYEQHDFKLVTIVPINASPIDWQGVAIFSRMVEMDI